jgi:cardiolipin synthase
MISCYVTLAVKKILPGWLSVVVISRDCIILIGVAVLSLMSVSYKIQPALIGKLTTAVQILTVFVFLVSRAVPGSVAASTMEGLIWITAFSRLFPFSLHHDRCAADQPAAKAPVCVILFHICLDFEKSNW